jgi:hypothetical protein
MGGLTEYPKPADSIVFLYYDRMHLHLWNGYSYDKDATLVISYQSITKLENMDEKKISAKRVIGLGLVALPLAIVGAMWKKNHVYTVIQYKGDVSEKIVILDFDDNLHIQGWIYRRTRLSQKTSVLTLSEGEFINYENDQYGFRIKYPKIWIGDELEQKTQDNTKVVEFRTFIENKAPFVTVYVTNLKSRNLSFKSLVNKEFGEVKDDQNMLIDKLSDSNIEDKSIAKLVYSDYHGFKRMVILIASNEIAFKISYYNEQKRYQESLPLVDKMINSFEMFEAKTKVSINKHEKENNNEDPLVILKRRFAKGEISEEDYERMRQVLDN